MAENINLLKFKSFSVFNDHSKTEIHNKTVRLFVSKGSKHLKFIPYDKTDSDADILVVVVGTSEEPATKHKKILYYSDGKLHTLPPQPTENDVQMHRSITEFLSVLKSSTNPESKKTKQNLEKIKEDLEKKFPGIQENDPIEHAALPTGLMTHAKEIRAKCNTWRIKIVESSPHDDSQDFLSKQTITRIQQLLPRVAQSLQEFGELCKEFDQKIQDLRQELGTREQSLSNYLTTVHLFTSLTCSNVLKELHPDDLSENTQTIFGTSYTEVFAALLGVPCRNNLQAELPRTSAMSSHIDISLFPKPDSNLEFLETSILIREDKIDKNLNIQYFKKVLVMMRMKLSHYFNVLYQEKRPELKSRKLYILGLVASRTCVTLMKLRCNNETGAPNANEYELQILEHTDDTAQAAARVISAIAVALTDRYEVHHSKGIESKHQSSAPIKSKQTDSVNSWDGRVFHFVKKLNRKVAVYKCASSSKEIVVKKSCTGGVTMRASGVQHDNILMPDALNGKLDSYPLLEQVKKATLQNEQALVRFATQAADALAYLHQKKIIHRDVKLENFVFDRINNKYLLIDFETVCYQGETSNTLSGIIGTDSYLAPEAMEFHSYKMDVWALGITIAELLLNKTFYYEYDKKNDHKKECRKIWEMITNASVKFTGLKEKLWALAIMKCLQFSTNDRIDMAQLLGELKKLSSGQLEVEKAEPKRQHSGESSKAKKHPSTKRKREEDASSEVREQPTKAKKQKMQPRKHQ